MKIKRYSLIPKAVFGMMLMAAAASDVNAQLPPLVDCGGTGAPPSFAQPCGHATRWAYINNVVTTGGMVNFNNSGTGCGNGATSYSDYTGTSMYVKQIAGQSVDIKVTWLGNTSQTITSALNKVYIDWNRNGIFETPQEYASDPGPYSGTHPHLSNSGSTITMKVKVPASAKEGLTRMRVVSSANISFTQGINQPCQITFGEVEDYTFEVVNPCLPPNVVSIANLNYKSADFSWTPKENAEFYEYIITPVDTIPHDTVSGFTFTTNTNTDVDTFQCDTKYYIMVRVVCDTAGRIARDWKRSAWIRDSFTTEPCCYAPNLKYDKLTHSTVRVQWDPIQTAYGYEYAVSTTPDPPQKGHLTINTAIVQQGLSPKTTYFFFVRSRCSPTPLSDWSKVSFKTLGGVSVENVQGGTSFSMDAYPNPMQNSLTVQLNGDMGGNAKLTIIDLTGKTVYNASVKTDKVVIDASELPSGIYIVKYADDTHNEVMRVTKK